MVQEEKPADSKAESKSHTISLRLDDETYQKLMKYVAELNIKKSQILKEALLQWFLYKMDVSQENLILIRKTFFSKMFNFIELDKIEELAKYSARSIGDKLRFKLMKQGKSISIEQFLKIYKRTLGPTGHFWFNNIEYKILDDGTLLILGNHSLNEKFSVLSKLFFKLILKEEFNYSLIENEAKISEDTMHLIFKPEHSL